MTERLYLKNWKIFMSLKSWTIEKLISASGAELISHGNASSFKDISIDSRRVTKDSVFIAVKGETLDGHDFIESAINNDASCIIMERDKKITEKKSISILAVQDSIKALGDLAKYKRENSKTKIIGVTGSVGKTSTREMIKCILKENFKVLAPEKNFNNHIGVPLTLLNLNDHDYAIIEMGMSNKGEISYLSEIAKPDISIITKIAPAHMAAFSSIEEIADEKLDIIKGAEKNSFLIINSDDHDLFNTDGLNIKTFGENKNSDLVISNISLEKNSAKADLNFKDKPGFQIELNLPGKTNLLNAAGAALVSSILGVKPDNIKNGLMKYKGVQGRFFKYEKKGITIIDDTYNANPESVKAALEDFSQIKKNGRGFIAIGDMLELGVNSNNYHEEIGRIAAKTSPSGIFAYGNFSEFIVKGAAVHINKDTFLFKGTHNEIADKLKKELKAGDWLLIKGSRGSKMETIIDLIFNTEE